MAATKPKALIDALITALAANATISAYVTAQWPGKTLTYYVGVDDNVMPQESDCPYLAMRPGTMVPSDDRSHRPIGVEFALITSNSGTTVSGSKTTLDGMAQIQDLYYLIEDVLETYFETNYGKYTVSYQDSTFEVSLPLYRMTWAITAQGDYE